MSRAKYKIRIVRGAFVDAKVLDELGAEVVEKLGEGDKWISINKVTATLEQVKELQKQMVKHYDDPNIPWYMDGYREGDKYEYIMAFGADDGEGGKIFQFKRSDEKAIQEVVDYGISKGIPAEQMDFHKIDF